MFTVAHIFLTLPMPIGSGPPSGPGSPVGTAIISPGGPGYPGGPGSPAAPCAPSFPGIPYKGTTKSYM